jgi:hypothetical protein
MKRTFKQLKDIDNLVGSLYTKDDKLQDTKFGYAYKRFTDKNVTEIYKKFQRTLLDVRIDNALEDEKTKEVLIDNMNVRGFKYSKVGLKKVVEDEDRVTKEFEAQEIDVEPYISSYIPELTEEEVDLLDGLLINKNGIQNKEGSN